MYRVLIVDDEPIIVNSIYQILQQAMHLELEIYRAYHALEALEILQKTRVDLVISDIRMPGMDGIEMQSEIIKKWPLCKIVFLTGYNELEYMQRALRNGGIVDYLLKNEDDELIVRAVEKALKQIEQQEGLMQRVQQANSKHQIALSILRKNALLEQVDEGTEALGLKFEQAEIPLAMHHPVWVMVGKIDDWFRPMSAEDQELLKYACLNIMAEFLAPSSVHVSITYEADRLLWAIQPKEFVDGDESLGEAELLWMNLRSRMASIVESAQEACHTWLKLPISFALGGAPCDWKQFGGQVERLNKLLLDKGYQRRELLIQDSDELPTSGNEMLDLVESPSEPHAPRIIRYVNDYIRSNIDQELSLTKLSELVHHSPTYLSRLYKRLTGTTLFEFITEQRMIVAKQLLKESMMKIHEIATAVGYESAPHFTRFFKKNVGLTPQEYRDS